MIIFFSAGKMKKCVVYFKKYDLWLRFNWKMEANRGSLSNYLFMIDWPIKFECESEHDKIYRRINNIFITSVIAQWKIDEVIRQHLN